MNIWNTVRRALSFADRPPMPYRPSAMTFQDLDADAIKSNMRLETRGRRRGENDEPRSDAGTLDEVEQEILDFIQNERKKSTEQYLQNMRAFAARLSNLDLEKSVGDIKNEADKATTDFNIEAIQGLDNLSTLESELREAKRDLNLFQQDNDLRSGATIKSIPWLGVSVLLMVALFILESIFNGQMLGQGLMSGLSGGLVYAMGFAFINVLIGLFLGQFGFRGKNHVRPGRAISGILIIVALLALSFVFNLGVAHYRDALEGADWERAQELALQAYSGHPFVLETLPSYILFGFGILIGIIVGTDVYYMDDPYPGYGRVTRHYRKARQDFMDGKDHIKDQLQQWRDNAIKEMEISREQAGRWRTEYGTIISSLHSLGHALEVHNAHLQSVANRLLQCYRGENSRARKAPPPKHFSNEFSFATAGAPQVPIPRILEKEQINLLVEDATTVLGQAVISLNAEYQKHMRSFSTIAEVLASGS